MNDITDTYSCIQKCSWRWPTHCMDRSASWQANSYSSAQEIRCLLWGRNVTWYSSFFFNGEEYFEPHQTSKLQDHPSDVCDCVFSIFAATLLICNVSSIINLRTHHAVATHLTLFNPLNTELNPICHLLVLLGAHHILHVGRIKVRYSKVLWPNEVYSVHCLYSTKKLFAEG